MPSFSMNTSTNKTTPAEVSASPNFVLSLLAACSTAVPASGLQGEATLSEQLSALLQDKAMAEDELCLLYSYRFGFGISDALKFAGFQGTLQDFLGQEKKRFCVRDGSISLTPVVVATEHEAPLAADELRAKSADDDDDSVSNAETESTNAADSGDFDSDSEDVDVNGWHSVGNRLIAAFDSLDSSDAQDPDVVLSVAGWKVLGGRGVLAAFRDADDADIVAWQDVGSRFARACKRNVDEERLQDVSPDASEWMSVGTRVYRCLDTLEVATEEL